MTMISVNEFKNGLTIEYNNDLWRIVEFQHVKPGKGGAFVRSKLKSLRTGAVQEYTFRSTAKVETADIQTRQMQYLYNDGSSYVFMDTATYEQLEVPNAQIDQEAKYLKENMIVNIISHNGETLGLDLPNTVDLKSLKPNQASAAIPHQVVVSQLRWKPVWLSLCHSLSMLVTC